MNPLAGLLAPALAVLPVALSVEAERPAPVSAAQAGAPESAARLMPADPPGADAGMADPGPWRSFAAAAAARRDADRAAQVRIEQRVIIRVAPGAMRGPPVDMRRGMLSPVPGPIQTPRTIERKTAQCLPVGAIAGVQPDGSRLLLFLRDQRVLSATLEKGCRPRDYYSGFLVERTSDGMLCAGRDKLLARSGANCAMGSLRQVVMLDDDD